MSKAKKLDLPYEKLCEIAKALNENIIANKLRPMGKRVTTDHFLRREFNISRKDFGFTAKGVGIKYNPTTFFYEIPNYNSDTKVILNTKSNINAIQEMAATSQEDNEKEIQNYKSNTSVTLNSIEEIMPTLSEMIHWYKLQKDVTKKIRGKQNRVIFK